MKECKRPASPASPGQRRRGGLLFALACLAAAGSAYPQQRSSSAPAAQAQPGEPWRREYTISLPLGESVTRETLRLQAMAQARERASTEFGAIVLHEQALFGDALSAQTRVLSAGLVRLGLRSETVRQAQGDSVFLVDFVIQAQIDPAELDRQAAALRSTLQRDLAIRALQQENEELRQRLRAAPAASPSGGAGPAAAPAAQGPAIAPRVATADPGHSTPLPDLAARQASAQAQVEREREFAWSTINELMLDAYRRAPKEVRHGLWQEGSGYRVNVFVEFKVDEEYWKTLGRDRPQGGLVRGSNFAGCFEFRESNHWFQAFQYRLFAEISIGGISTYEILSASTVGGWTYPYCGRRKVKASILVPQAAFAASREVIVRVVPETQARIKLESARNAYHQLRDADW